LTQVGKKYNLKGLKCYKGNTNKNKEPL